jgi:hypothetical protein
MSVAVRFTTMRVATIRVATTRVSTTCIIEEKVTVSIIGLIKKQN